MKNTIVSAVLPGLLRLFIHLLLILALFKVVAAIAGIARRGVF